MGLNQSVKYGQMGEVLAAQLDVLSDCCDTADVFIAQILLRNTIHMSMIWYARRDNKILARSMIILLEFGHSSWLDDKQIVDGTHGNGIFRL
jgi:hypothetical protein